VGRRCLIQKKNRNFSKFYFFKIFRKIGFEKFRKKILLFLKIELKFIEIIQVGHEGYQVLYPLMNRPVTNSVKWQLTMVYH
jgi:hypothetical protein